MANQVTQYIGARYVPKFFENSNGTSEWTANTAYEALTIVTRNGNSYTSKIPVPASVGAPEDNANYWVSTGLYNAQVQQLQDNIETVQENLDDEETARTDADTSLSNRISILESGTTLKRRYILIGDSYGRGVVGPGGGLVNGWTYYFKQFLGLSDDDCFINCADGAGFIGLQTTTFLDLINSANATNPNTITDIVIAGGRNDLDASSSALRTAIGTFYSTAKTLYPNAILSLCFCGCYWDRSNNNHDKLINTRAIYAQDMRYKNLPQAATYMSFMSASVGGTDTTHFNEEGYKALGRWIATCAVGGKPELEVPYAAYPVTPAEGITVSGGLTGRVYDGDFIWNNTGNFNFIFASGYGNISGGTSIEIGELPAPFYGGYSAWSCSVPVTLNIKERAGGFILGHGAIQIRNKKVYLFIGNGNPNGGGYQTFTDVSSIAMQGGAHVIKGEEIFG